MKELKEIKLSCLQFGWITASLIFMKILQTNWSRDESIALALEFDKNKIVIKEFFNS